MPLPPTTNRAKTKCDTFYSSADVERPCCSIAQAERKLSPRKLEVIHEFEEKQLTVTSAER